MMDFSRDNRSGCPCRGCGDRYPGCHDHCGKAEYLRWKTKMAEKKKAEREYKEANYTMSEDKKREMWRGKRYSRQVRYNKSNKAD